MPTIAPVITVQSSPAIEITIPGSELTYQQLLASLTPQVYELMEVYYSSQLAAQFSFPFFYFAYDSFGKTDGKPVLTPLTPGQYQDTMYMDLKKKSIYANGSTALSFTLLADNLVQFIFWGKTYSVMHDLDTHHQPDNFKSIESALGKPGFCDADEDDQEELPEIILVPD